MSFFKSLFGEQDSPEDLHPLPCDRCSGSVEVKTGYAFYSTAGMNGMELGNMLLCDSCTNKIMTESFWQVKIREVERGEHAPTDKQLSDYAYRNRIDVSMIALCIGLNLSPEQAKNKAKKLTKYYWCSSGMDIESVTRAWNKNRP